jgi:hypothetical protein
MVATTSHSGTGGSDEPGLPFVPLTPQSSPVTTPLQVICEHENQAVRCLHSVSCCILWFTMCNVMADGQACCYGYILVNQVCSTHRHRTDVDACQIRRRSPRNTLAAAVCCILHGLPNQGGQQQSQAQSNMSTAWTRVIHPYGVKIVHQQDQ